MRFSLLVMSAVLAAMVACTFVGIGDLDFACQSADDCSPGFDCVGGGCRVPGQDAGEDAGADGGDAGCAQSFESCANVVDDDCDGLQDCADPDCAGQTCGASGRSCSGGLCLCADGGAGP